MGTIYDENDGRYEVNGNYLLPCLTIGSTGKNKIGVWWQRHKRYLKSHHRVFYYNLLTSCKLDDYLCRPLQTNVYQVFSLIFHQFSLHQIFRLTF